MTGPHHELLQRARYALLHWPSTFTRCEKTAKRIVNPGNFYYGSFHRGLVNFYNVICLIFIYTSLSWKPNWPNLFFINLDFDNLPSSLTSSIFSALYFIELIGLISKTFIWCCKSIISLILCLYNILQVINGLLKHENLKWKWTPRSIW